MELSSSYFQWKMEEVTTLQITDSFLQRDFSKGESCRDLGPQGNQFPRSGTENTIQLMAELLPH
jgi:hypothetical protein